MANYIISATLTLRDQMTAKIQAARRAAEGLTKGIGDAKNRDVNFRVNVQGQEKINRLREMLRQAGHNLPPINLRVNDNGATSKITKLRSDVTSLAGKAHTVVVNVRTNGAAALGRLKNNISEMATGAAMGMGAGMLGVAGVGFGAVDMVNTYKDFEYQMMRNKALFTTGLDAETAQQQYIELEKAARHYGSIMKFTASEVGKAEEYMALAGWDAPTAIAALPAVLNAAVASGEDLALVSDIITDDMTAMGYKAGDIIQNAMGENVEAAQHFADVMLRTTLRSNTNFQQLGLAMKYAAPLAHTLGYQIEDVAVAMGLMANNGIKADQAGTGLRGILNRFINEPKKAAESMERLGVSLFDAQGNAKSLIPMLMDVRAALRGKTDDEMIDFAEMMTGEQVENRQELTDFLKEAKERGGGKISQQDQAKLGSMLSGTYAMAAFMAIMNSSDEDIQKLMNEIYRKSDGTGADIAKQMSNTLKGDLDTLKSAWEDFNIELLSGGGGDGIRNFVQGLTDDINTFKTSLKDGLDFKDIANLGAKVFSQLKNKFLELDGIGSVLAGGALFMGLKKILSMALSLKDTLSAWSRVRTAGDLGGLLRGNQGALTSQVGTMHVSAGVVNVNGAVRGGTPAGGQRGGTVVTGGNGGRPSTGGTVITNNNGARPSTGTTILTGGKSPTSTGGIITNQNARPATGGVNSRIITTAGAAAATTGSILLSNRSGSNITTYNPAIRQQEIAARNSAYVNDYYARRGNILASTPSPIPPTTAPAPTGAMSNIRANIGGIGAGVGISALFAAMDLYSARQNSEVTMNEARETLAYHKNVLSQMQEQNRGQEEIAAQMKEVADAEAFVDRTRTMNQRVERQAEMGAAGMVAGTAIGAAIGSLFPVVGTMIGGMIGGTIGQLGGTMLAQYSAEQEDKKAAERANQAADRGVAFVKEQVESGKTTGMAIVANDEREIWEAERRHQERLNKQTQNNPSTETVKLREQGFESSNWTNYGRIKSAEQVSMGGFRQQEENARNSGHGGAEGSFGRRTGKEAYQEMIDKQEAAKVAHQRDLYNKRWQEQFGTIPGMSRPDFVPATERERELLAQYDRDKAYKARQERMQPISELKERADKASKVLEQGFEIARDNQPTLSEMASQKAKDVLTNARDNQPTLADMATAGVSAEQALALQTQADNVSKVLEQGFEIARDNQSSKWYEQKPPTDFKTTFQAADEAREKSSHAGEKFFEGIGDFFDNLLFNKAAASEITPETNMTLSSPPSQETVPAVEMPKPTGGFFDDFKFPELPDFGKMFSGVELPDFSSLLDKLPKLSEIELPNFSEIFSGIELPDISGIFDKLPKLSEIELPNFSEIFSGIELPDISGVLDKIPSLSEIELPNLGELFSTDFEIPDFGAKISEMVSGIDIPNLGAALGEIFSGIELPELGIGEKISMEFEGATEIFSSFTENVSATFSGLAGTISGALSGVGSAITTVFSSAASEVQGIWGAMPGFFSGVFSGLGGVAAAAGGAIMSGLTGVIGSIIGAWQSAAATISGIISSIASAASAAASAIPSFGIGGHAKGAGYFEGGFTEINEHGGEILNLPKGTQIIPHATTVNILRHEIRNSIANGESNYHGLNFADYGLTNNFAQNQAQSSFMDYNLATSNILGGDLITTMPDVKPNKEVKTGTRWNMKKPTPYTSMTLGKGIWAELFGRIMDGINNRGSRETPLSGDVITTMPDIKQDKEVKTGTRWNMKKPDIFGGIMGGILGGGFEGLGSILGGLGGMFGGSTGLPMIMNFGSDLSSMSQTFNDNFSSSNFGDSFDLKMPETKLPQIAESSSSNSTSNSNTINFGGVNINNGADFDEFVFRLQQLMGHAMINSESV